MDDGGSTGEIIIGLIVIAAVVVFWYMRRRKRQAHAVAEIPKGSLDVVGESHYQEALASIAGPKREDGFDLPVTVELRREPDNPYSTEGNAIMCLIDGKKVGYINHDDSARLQPLLLRAEKKNQTVVMSGRIVGGWSRRGGTDEGHYGVKIENL